MNKRAALIIIVALMSVAYVYPSGGLFEGISKITGQQEFTLEESYTAIIFTKEAQTIYDGIPPEQKSAYLKSIAAQFAEKAYDLCVLNGPQTTIYAMLSADQQSCYINLNWGQREAYYNQRIKGLSAIRRDQ